MGRFGRYGLSRWCPARIRFDLLTFLSDTGEIGSYRWTASGGYSVLSAPSGGNSPRNPTVVAVSADGQTLAGYMEHPFEGFRWTAETGVVGLGRQAGGRPVESEVHGMSADGRYIVGLNPNGQPAATFGGADLTPGEIRRHSWAGGANRVSM